MNDVLHLKGRLEQAKKQGRPGSAKLPAAQSIATPKLEKLRDDLLRFKKDWSKEQLLPGALISVFYNKVAAKSNRIDYLLSKGKQEANDSVVGARFYDESSPKHIITHYVSMDVIDTSIEALKNAALLLDSEFGGKISQTTIEKIKEFKIDYEQFDLSRTRFLKILQDAYYVERFDTLIDELELNQESIITLYETDVETKRLLSQIGIDISYKRILDTTTVLLFPDELSILKQKAPYLISMAVTDLAELTKADFEFHDADVITIPKPGNEPIIGVIDTPFDKGVYFSDWVEYENMIDPQIEISPKDYYHGTAVSSIIVDGPASNPELDDGCGRFRVRHFGVAAGEKFSSFTILRQIKEIVNKNPDIKVWNLSLGSKLEIRKNFISPEAAILDKIQYENDVIFVIAGTNNDSGETKQMAIGSPADSINSIVVNSVNSKGKPASYTRQGPVLSFFIKPDISYYGGDVGEKIQVCTPTGVAWVDGTSYAAPWIARKMSYLIDILGLSREVAKALLINSATGWDKSKHSPFLVGHGVVPKRIEEIVQSPKDEIRFILSGTSQKWDTYTYNIPVPVSQEMHPFVAKATLCYFPLCSRNQGVDYTNTELDIQLGRVNKGGITPINNNYQNMDTLIRTFEKDARKNFRKWDNCKHIREVLTPRNRARKCYDRGLWGISLKKTERLNQKDGQGMNFGLVVSLKEINGVNRIDEFIKNCALRGWLVNKIDVESRIDIYNIGEEKIEFSE